MIRPEASRRGAGCDPDGLPLMLPEASRYWVVAPEQLPVRVSALPVIRPLASRYSVRALPPTFGRVLAA
jgi:hypothetical protein